MSCLCAICRLKGVNCVATNVVQNANVRLVAIEGHINGAQQPRALMLSSQVCSLSKDRAEAVKVRMALLSVANVNMLSFMSLPVLQTALVGLGVAPDRMRSQGFGDTQMVFPNATTLEEMQANMRVELKIETMDSRQ